MAYNSIFFGTIDSQQVEAEIVAQYVQLAGRTPNPGDPEFAINATIAYARVLALQAIERAGKCNLIQFAEEANLDYLAAIIGLERIDEQASVVRIKFTLVDGHAQVVILGGTLVSSTDGKAVYSTDEDYTVAVGINEVTLNCTCTTEGSFSNGYAIDTITTIQNPQPYLLAATNIEATSGGADVETDASFRSRWADALEKISVAGPKGAYRYHARTASLTIVSVEVLGPEDDVTPSITPGSVEIRVLVDTGVPTQGILDLVFDACDPETVRPMNDTVIVRAAELITYSLTCNITAFIGANTSALPGLVEAALKVYTDAQGNSIGADVVEDALTSAGMIAGVKRLEFPGFNDIPVNMRQFARCSGFTVNVVATEAP